METLPTNTCQVAVYLSSFDVRRQCDTNVVDLIESTPFDAVHVTLVNVGIATQGQTSAKTTRTSAPIEADPLMFYTSLLEWRLARIQIELVHSGRVLAFGSTPPLGRANPVSLMGEIDPKGGRVSVPLYSTQPATNNRFLGTFTFEYIVTTPLSHPLRNLPTKTAFEWAPNGKTTLVGHRGLGMNLDAQQKCGQVLQLGENTIASFAKAHELGAHFVEFDTQVSKDGVVLLYHDNVLDETGFHVEINDLTEQEFRALKPKFAVSAREYPETIDRATTLRRARSTGNLVALAPLPSEITGTKKAKRPWKGNYVGCIQEPFTTLKEALQTLPTSLGFNIEIKYPLPDEIEREGLKSFEANRFVDAILNTVLDHAGDERAIIFSCFNAEAARMAKLKQSRYPVLFLTMGGTHETIDTRLNSVQAAARFASRFGLDGIVTSAAPVLADLALIARAKEVMRGGRALVLTYGGLNCVKGNAKRLMWAGLDGIIVDTVRQVREELDADS